MLSDETISNSRLHRDTRLEPNAQPFIVPTNGQVKATGVRQQQQRRAAVERATSPRSSKSTVDAKNRAVSDSCMAAAIGDLQWLKQSIRDGPIGNGEITTIEQTYGKDVCFERNICSLKMFILRLFQGLAPIHLAALHGRLNCLSYLVETIHVDINAPSATGWRPLHLCISKETGLRSFQCLQYLVDHDAQTNV